MTRELNSIKRKVLPILKKSGIKRSAIFGSFARGEATKKSDVDLLIEPPGRFTLLDLIELEQELENVLQKNVDLLTYRSIHKPLRPYILRDAVSIL